MNTFLTTASGIIQLSMAVLGIYVSLVPQLGERHKRLMFRLLSERFIQKEAGWTKPLRATTLWGFK